MFFKQIKLHGDNFSYIIAEDESKETAIIDPSYNADAINSILREQNLKVKYVINTHSHNDHTAGNKDIKSKFNAKVVAHRSAAIIKNISVADGDVLRLGTLQIKVLHTPGHSPDSICLLVGNKLLTGDTLFVGECGRTDLQGGSSKDMYDSLFHKLMKLDGTVEVYPGHDYGAKNRSTISFERQTNYTLAKRTLIEFIEFMEEP